MVGDGFEAGAYLARLRRLADLSQRDLAQRTGLPQSTIAAYEANRCQVTARRLDQVLRAGGLRLAVVDARDEEVEPFPADAVRDNADRRFPAHLDVQPPDVLPAEVLRAPRYDRLPARAWHHRRAERDRLRADQPPESDHPTVAELEQRVRTRAAERRARALARRAAVADRLVADPCTCPVDCWEHAGCAPGCPCRCEDPAT